MICIPFSSVGKKIKSSQLRYSGLLSKTNERKERGFKKLCVGKGVTRQLGFINCVERVNWRTYRVYKTHVSSVSPSSFALTKG